MIVIDATRIDDPSDADEMLGYCLRYAQPDDVITLHGNWCRTQLGALEPCTCTPQTLRLGAKA